MAVDTVHPDYAELLPDWTLLRDVVAGQRAMQQLNRDYLRRPQGVDDDIEWSRRVKSTPFFEATQRTIEGLTGLAFYRTPEIKLPEAAKPLVEDCTQDGVPLEQFLEATFEELLTMARLGVLVDMPPKDPRIRSVRDAEKAKRRAFLRRYRTEDILNWSTGMVDGVVKLTQVRLAEIEQETLDDFTLRWRAVIRVLELVKDGETWTYRQRIFEHRDWKGVDGEILNPVAQGTATAGTTMKEASPWVEGKTITPLMNDKPLDFIPFWIINPSDHTPDVRRPPLLGLANMNVAHFNTTERLENSQFWLGNPKVVITGVDPDTVPKLAIGSSDAWVFKNENATATMLAATSTDYSALERRLERQEQHMAALGARSLVGDPKGVEAADTARIHRQGEISVLARTCNSLSRAATDFVKVAVEWSGYSGESKIKLNTVFFDQEISLDDLTKAVGLWQKNVISIDDLIALGKRADVISADATQDSIVASNQSSAIQPIIPNLTGTGQPIDPNAPLPPRPTLKPNPPKPTPAPAPAK